MNESKYRTDLILKLRHMFPGCIVLKNDASYMQGVPDIMILFNDKWAMLETKISDHAKKQPNQAYYVNILSQMSFASFISPENEEAVLNDLQRTFGSSRKARVS